MVLVGTGTWTYPRIPLSLDYTSLEPISLQALHEQLLLNQQDQRLLHQGLRRQLISLPLSVLLIEDLEQLLILIDQMFLLMLLAR
jgi:hypothetical protein